MAKPDEPIAQLATRIPKDLQRRLKLHCVTNDIMVQDFVVEAIEHKPSAQGTAVIASAAGPQMIPTGCVPCASGDLTGAGGLDG
jgi:hypothetical protein